MECSDLSELSYSRVILVPKISYGVSVLQGVDDSYPKNGNKSPPPPVIRSESKAFLLITSRPPPDPVGSFQTPPWVHFQCISPIALTITRERSGITNRQRLAACPVYPSARPDHFMDDLAATWITEFIGQDAEVPCLSPMEPTPSGVAFT